MTSSAMAYPPAAAAAKAAAQSASAIRPERSRMTSALGAPGVSTATTPPPEKQIVPPGSPVTSSTPDSPAAAHP